MLDLTKWSNSDLKNRFAVAQVAEKHDWPEPLVWSLALEDKTDLELFKELGWGLRTWDVWNWNDCDKRFGDEWPGQIPALRPLNLISSDFTALKSGLSSAGTCVNVLWALSALTVS
jgi:hypothetical protein